ncbi:MAG: hypothetical protein IPP40_12040 [bacterium]|nr:hypothetical protein [bacterium]
MSTNNLYDEGYAQKVLLDGQLAWEQDGVLLCQSMEENETQQNISVLTDYSGGIVCSWLEGIG